jgi:hypothetical protein
MLIGVIRMTITKPNTPRLVDGGLNYAAMIAARFLVRYDL